MARFEREAKVLGWGIKALIVRTQSRTQHAQRARAGTPRIVGCSCRRHHLRWEPDAGRTSRSEEGVAREGHPYSTRAAKMEIPVRRIVLMNKIRLTMLLALLTAASSSIALAQGVSAGVKGGLSIATISTDVPGIATDSLNRVHAGGVVSVDLTQTFSIQIEGLFSQKGSNFDDPFEFGVGRFEFDYVEIPILAKVKIATGSVSPHVFAGPAIAFETSCTIKAEVFADDVDCDEIDDPLERKSVNVGVIFGGGLEIEAGPGVVTVDAAYNVGLRNICDESCDIKTRTFYFSVGYLFGGG